MLARLDSLRSRLRSATNFHHLHPAERSNYLRQCWRTGRWVEGAREWIAPSRYVLYRLRENIATHGQKPHRYSFAVPAPLPTTLTTNIADVYVTRMTFPPEVDCIPILLTDVERQLHGIHRLGGNYYHNIRENGFAGIRDDEHHHAYHRLYWAVRYAQAAALGYPEAESGLCFDLSQWLAVDWTGSRYPPYPYTTSERIAGLVEVIFWIRHGKLRRAAEMIIPIKQCLFRDACHLVQNVEYRQDFNNHILNNARALYLASRMLPECPEAAIWEKTAFEIWDKYYPLLVLIDGTFHEQSSHYHFLMCRTALEYVLAAKQAGHALPSGFNDRVGAMFSLANDLLRDDGTLMYAGDISPDHTASDLWGLLAAAHWHGLLAELPRHSVTTMLTLYYCGRDPDLPDGKNTQPAASAFYPSGGWAFLRQPKLGVELTIHGDPRQQTYCHGDSGRGTFELRWRGVTLIREPGNPTYYEKARHWYRSGAGQNVTCLGGLAAGISYEDQGKLPDWYAKQRTGHWDSPAEGGFRFWTMGLSRLGTDIRVERTWWWKTSVLLELKEELLGTGTFQFSSSLHLGDAPWQSTRPTVLECHHPTSTAKVTMTVRAPEGVATHLRPGNFAPEYGVENPGQILTMTGYVELPLEWSVTLEFSEP